METQKNNGTWNRNNVVLTLRSKNTLTWVLAGLLALVFIASGFTKLLGAEMQVKNIASWGYPAWTIFPIGLSEIAIGIGVLLPAFQKLTAYGIFPWAIIAVITHLQAGQANMIGTPVVIAILAFAMLWALKAKVKQQ